MEKHTFGNEYGFQTRAVHTGNDIDAETGAIKRPITMANSYALPYDPSDLNWSSAGKNLYTRNGGSNQQYLQEKLASLEGGEDCVVLASGVAALSGLFFALLESGEFSWASLNFAKGRLVVEAAAARPKPDIAAGTLHGIRAKCSGTVLRTNLTSGTMLVQPGQQVEAGQGLIGTARAERDGTLIFAPAAGTVVAQFEWSDTRTVPLEETVQQYTGACTRAYRVTAFGHTFSLPAAPAPEHAAVILRHFQPEVPLLGLALPCSVEETCRYVQQPETLHRTEAQAAALARLQSLQALYAAWPDAERIARKEDCTVNGNVLDYTVTYTVAADICG